MRHKIVLKSLVLVITDYYMYANIIVIIRTPQFFSPEECANIVLYQIIICCIVMLLRLDCFLFVLGMSPFKFIKA